METRRLLLLFTLFCGTILAKGWAQGEKLYGNEAWRKKGADPEICTNDILLQAGLTYEDLGKTFAERWNGSRCIPVVLHYTRPSQVKSFEILMDSANTRLRGMLGSRLVKELTIRSSVMAKELKVNSKGNARQVLPSIIVGIREELDNANKAGKNSTAVEGIHVFSGFGNVSRTAFTTKIGDDLIIFVGDEVMKEQRANYFIHVLNNSMGMVPIWGRGEECGNDEIMDTPLHSGPNFDCNTGHVSACETQHDELNDNVMDARWCVNAYNVTPEQKTWMLDRYLLKGDETADCGSSNAQKPTNTPRDCRFSVSPDPLAISESCELTISRKAGNANEQVQVMVSRAGGVVKSLNNLSFEEQGACYIKLDVCVMNLEVGSYQFSIIGKTDVCSQTFIIE